MDRRACSEVNYIINQMPQEMKVKIPTDVIKNIQSNMDKDYIVELKDIEYDELLPDTEKILASLYRLYCSGRRKKSYKRYRKKDKGKKDTGNK